MDDQVSVMQEKEGTVTFANEVLSTIVGIAACDIPGVAGMCGGLKDGIVELLGKKNFSKGVKVSIKDNAVTADLAIVVNYGVSVPEICANIQQSVKKALDTMTGLAVAAVNIAVEGISIKDETKETE
ncbi:MAG: Asp23/Gls24 family envelope stress response protein [Christensenellaceae bacterium]|nr:Asp23/Gls24 family envelope stress response protein [Christensenellaceae bacterium]